MKRTFSATVAREGDWFVAQCLEVDVASQGSTEAEALANLAEALTLHFDTPTATVFPRVIRVEATVRASLAARLQRSSR
jgi:predicted RNase H-like HicB family nuclease